jgi:hypothetical protein
MFVCFALVSLVINLIYSGQQPLDSCGKKSSVIIERRAVKGCHLSECLGTIEIERSQWNKTMDHFHKTSFPSSLTNVPNKLECFIAFDCKVQSGTDTLAYKVTKKMCVINRIPRVNLNTLFSSLTLRIDKLECLSPESLSG